MAVRKGQYGRSSYGSAVSGNILKDINLMQSSGETVKPAGTTDGTAKNPRTKRGPLTAEQIAADPVLSGKLSVDQAKINYIRAQQALNLMPGEGVTGSAYDAQLKKANAAIAKLKVKPQDAEQQFFSLGGQMRGVGSSEGSNYGSSPKKILEYYRSVGMEDKGYEIVSKIYGNDRYGNPVEKSQPTVDYRLGSDSTFRMQSPTKNLSALQAARLTKLKNLKQGGATLGPKQLANIKRLRALAKG
jgi:hypothetical protein